MMNNDTIKTSAMNSRTSDRSSASSTSMTQDLQIQVPQILPAITQVLSAWQYSEMAHQRISQQSNGGESNYQGLTRAQHPEFGSVMIKWQLGADSQHSCKALQHEIAVFSDLTKNQYKRIAPPLLANHHVDVQTSNQQLTALVMPYYANGSLAQHPKHRREDSQKHQVIAQAAKLIANLHDTGWLHNDIKPSNVLRLDAVLADRADNSSITSGLLLTDFALAQSMVTFGTANIAGTPAYLAPERWQGQGVAVQSDVYAFGVMMYEILVGVRPFDIDKSHQVPLRAWAIQHCQRPIPTLPSPYRRYQPIIDTALAKRTQYRYQKMSDIVQALSSF